MTYKQQGLDAANIKALDDQHDLFPDFNSDFTPSAEAKTAQCRCVLAALRAGSQTTDDLRRLAVRSPASRVMELRKAGHVIVTERAGVQARYVLIGGAA